MEERLVEFFEDMPLIIENFDRMETPNSPIKIHEGVFRLKSDLIEIEMTGEVQLSWMPELRVQFWGHADYSPLIIREHWENNKTFSLILNNEISGKCYLTNFSTQPGNTQVRISGLIVKDIVVGDRTIPVTSVKFSIPNLLGLFGQSTKKIQEPKILFSKSRVLLENDIYTITIDKRNEYDALQKSLTVEGGFIIQYYGEIKKKKGSIYHSDLHSLFYCLDTFLSFLNGRKTSCLFLSGIYNDQQIWVDYSSSHVDPYKNVLTWPQKHSIEGINDIWNKFYSLWTSDDEKDFLSSAIHWYTESNKVSGFAEGSIIMAQTSLELLYNWLIVEKKQMLIGKDAESLSAANKIRLLLSYVGIKYEVPDGLGELKGYIQQEKIVDGPEVIVQIRNALIHSQEDKRKKISLIEPIVIVQTLRLSIWYIELSLLFILDYKGKYFNRCAKPTSHTSMEQNVPWV